MPGFCSEDLMCCELENTGPAAREMYLVSQTLGLVSFGKKCEDITSILKNSPLLEDSEHQFRGQNKDNTAEQVLTAGHTKLYNVCLR